MGAGPGSGGRPKTRFSVWGLLRGATRADDTTPGPGRCEHALSVVAGVWGGRGVGRWVEHAHCVSSDSRLEAGKCMRGGEERDRRTGLRCACSPRAAGHAQCVPRARERARAMKPALNETSKF